jgi:hypothetical protein
MNSIAQAQHTLSLVIDDVTILQDEDGRYSLNDLHRVAVASGVTRDIRPGEWLALAQTQELIEVLIAENSAVEPLKKRLGRYGGTFGVRELLYAYGMWISAVVNLRVIRAFDALMNGGVSRNMSSGMSPTNYGTFFNTRVRLMEKLSLCGDPGVGRSIYDNILNISRFLGLVTPPLRQLAPGLRQQSFLDEGGAA